MDEESASLQGKSALVTGASRGIGRAIAIEFARHGAQVMLTGRDRDRLADAVADAGPNCAGFLARTEEPSHAETCVAATTERFGGIDILVNNAAMNTGVGPLIEAGDRDLDRIWQTNTRAPLLWTQAAWRHSMRKSGGSVVNIASIGALYGGGPTGAYNLSKAGLLHLTRHLAAEIGPGVRINAIAPGLVRTELSRILWERYPAGHRWPWPLGRIGQSEDVAAAALYLAADHSNWMTGQVLVIDGGATTDGTWTAIADAVPHLQERKTSR
ncbi:SDR family oxidoreductase [Streptomyces sp. NPDC054796]